MHRCCQWTAQIPLILKIHFFQMYIAHAYFFLFSWRLALYTFSHLPSYIFLICWISPFFITALSVVHSYVEWLHFLCYWQNFFLLVGFSFSEESLSESSNVTAFLFLEFFFFFFLERILTTGGGARVSKFSILVSKKADISWIDFLGSNTLVRSFCSSTY